MKKVFWQMQYLLLFSILNQTIEYN